MLPDGRELILDAAHNPAGAATLASYLAETLGEKPPLVFAAMRDKDVARMFAGAAAGRRRVDRHTSRRTRDRPIRKRWRRGAGGRAGLPRRRRRRSASTRSPPRGGSRRAIVVAGSIFLLGDVMKETRRRDTLR